VQVHEDAPEVVGRNSCVLRRLNVFANEAIKNIAGWDRKKLSGFVAGGCLLCALQNLSGRFADRQKNSYRW